MGATWIRRDGLPQNQGQEIGSHKVKTSVGEMRAVCESDPECVGFAFWPHTGWWFTKKMGTGFTTDQNYSQSIQGETWEWHYILQRAKAADQMKEEKDASRLKQLKDDEKVKKLIWEAQGQRENSSYAKVPEIREDAALKVQEFRKEIHQMRGARHKAEANREVIREKEGKMHKAAVKGLKSTAIEEREKLTEDFKKDLKTLEAKEDDLKNGEASYKERTFKATEKLRAITDETKRL